MIERALWHPVALSTGITNRPVAANLLEEDIVLWRDAQGAVHAWLDQCPHRGAKLSLGQVRINAQGTGILECAYHGWQFDGAGQCTRVPALPAFTPPPAHCAKVFGSREAYGLVWVQLAAGPTPLPAFAPETDAQLRPVFCGPYDVATSAPRVVENFLDMAHFGFVHEGFLGARDHVAVADCNVERTAHGIRASGCRAWQPQSSAHAKQGAQVSYTYEVVSPYCAQLTKVPGGPPAESTDEPLSPSGVAPNDARQAQSDGESIALWVCPLTPETSRVWFTLAVPVGQNGATDGAAESGDAVLQAFQHTIFMQDKPILESQSPARLPLDLRRELHTAADKVSSAYRRYLHDSGITFGVC